MMSLWRRLSFGWRTLTRGRDSERELHEEVRHFFDEAAADLESRGLSAQEARYAVTRQMGHEAAVREQVRSFGWENVVESTLADFGYAARGLRASPSFAIVAILTLALGIGASTAIFSAAKPVLLDPLPYPGADRIVIIWDRGADDANVDVTFGTFREIAERSRDFDALAVRRTWQPALTGGTEPRRLDGERVSADYFATLGVRPVLGRDFRLSDDRVNGERVVVLSDRLWRQRFGADPAIVGQPIRLDGDQYVVIGVMPAGFENVLMPSADVWRPLQYDASLPSYDGREWGHHLQMVGRLREGIDLEQVSASLDAIARNPVGQFARPGWAALPRGVLVRPLKKELTSEFEPTLFALLGAVGILLAIACINVANLLLGRAAQRRAEYAMRAALGAGSSRLVRQVLAESVLVAMIGGACGLLIATAGIRALVFLSNGGAPRADAIAIDDAAYAFTLLLSAAAGVVAGLMPALRVRRGDLYASVQQGSRRATGYHDAWRAGLVVSQVALALVLLVGAGLLFRSVRSLLAVAPGFDAAQVMTLQVQVAGTGIEDVAVERFFSDALDAIRQVPGVTSAGFTSQLPLSGDDDRYGVHLESPPARMIESDGGVSRYAVGPGYLEALRIPLLRGRALDARDAAGMPRAVVITESLARLRFAGEDPIGRRVRIGAANGPWFTVVGVVGDVKQASLAAPLREAVYVTSTQWLFADRARWFVVRADGDPAMLAPSVRRAIWSIDRDQPIVRVALMTDLVSGSAAQRRFALTIFQAFSLVALVLAAIGIYGVLASMVTERTREIGVRCALGASRGSILALVAHRGIRLTVIGVAAGLLAAIAASSVLTSLLFEVSRVDPLTYAGVAAIVVGVAAMACAIPAVRAGRIDPAVTLRAE